MVDATNPEIEYRVEICELDPVGKVHITWLKEPPTPNYGAAKTDELKNFAVVQGIQVLNCWQVSTLNFRSLIRGIVDTASGFGKLRLDANLGYATLDYSILWLYLC